MTEQSKIRKDKKVDGRTNLCFNFANDMQLKLKLKVSMVYSHRSFKPATFFVQNIKKFIFNRPLISSSQVAQSIQKRRSKRTERLCWSEVTINKPGCERKFISATIFKTSSR